MTIMNSIRAILGLQAPIEPPQAPLMYLSEAKDVIARTAWGEAASLGSAGMQATINTGMNRLSSGVTWWGKDLRSIFIFQFKGIHQYSCWNANNPRLAAIKAVDITDPAFAQASKLAEAAIQGLLPDITNGATHYVNHVLVRPLPIWCAQATPTFKLEPHWYYRLLK